MARLDIIGPHEYSSIHTKRWNQDSSCPFEVMLQSIDSAGYGRRQQLQLITDRSRANERYYRGSTEMSSNPITDKKEITMTRSSWREIESMISMTLWLFWFSSIHAIACSFCLILRVLSFSLCVHCLWGRILRETILWQWLSVFLVESEEQKVVIKSGTISSSSKTVSSSSTFCENLVPHSKRPRQTNWKM